MKTIMMMMMMKKKKQTRFENQSSAEKVSVFEPWMQTAMFGVSVFVIDDVH